MAANFVTAGPIPMKDVDSQLSTVPFSFNGITAAAPGTIVAPVAGKRISVHAFGVGVANSPIAFNISEVTSAGATVTNQLGGAFGFNLQPGGFVLSYNQFPWMTCAAGNGLAMTATGTLPVVSGIVQYIQG